MQDIISSFTNSAALVYHLLATMEYWGKKNTYLGTEAEAPLFNVRPIK